MIRWNTTLGVSNRTEGGGSWQAVFGTWQISFTREIGASC